MAIVDRDRERRAVRRVVVGHHRGKPQPRRGLAGERRTYDAAGMPDDERQRLVGEGVMFYDNPQKLLADLGEAFVKIEGS